MKRAIDPKSVRHFDFTRLRNLAAGFVSFFVGNAKEGIHHLVAANDQRPMDGAAGGGVSRSGRTGVERTPRV